MDSQFIICGCFRSGTTILAKMLNKHNNLLVTNEIGLWAADTLFRIKLNQLANEPVGMILDYNAAIYNAFRDELRPQIKTITQWELIGLIQKYFGHDKCLYGEKMPEYTLYAPVIKKHIPNLKVLCCIRDGRDVIESQIRQYWRRRQRGIPRKQIEYGEFWCRPDVDECIRLDRNDTWLYYMQQWDKSKAELDYHEVYYRDLVASPGAVAAEIAQFLDVESAPLEEVFHSDFIPSRHEVWKEDFPEIYDELPVEWTDMLTKYGFEV